MGVVSPGSPRVESRNMLLANQFRDAGWIPPGQTVAVGADGARALPEGIFRVGDAIPNGTLAGMPVGTDVLVPEIPAQVGPPAVPAVPAVTGVIVTETMLLNPANAWLLNPTLAANQAWPPNGLAAVAFKPERAPVFGLVASEDLIGWEEPDEYGLTRIRAMANLINLPEDPITRLPVGYPPRIPDETDEAYTIRLQDWVDAQEAINGTREVALPGFGVADNGDISVIMGNRKVVIGRLGIAMFANAAGLETAGNSLYRQTASSGEVVITEAFQDGAGKIEGGGLEMSNVDLANEFTDMIVTQRGFQANSRIISVTDSMLEELVNLKR